MSLPLLVAAMVAATVVGVLAERRWHGATERGSRTAMQVMLTWVLPPVYFVLVTRLHVDGAVVGGVVTAYLVLAVIGLLAWWAATRLLRLSRPATGGLILAVVLANTGYFGLPFTRAMLGGDELGNAVAWDSFVSGPMFFAVAFAIGAAFSPTLGADGDDGRGERLRAFVRNPLLWSAIIGLAVPWDAPNWAYDVAQAFVVALLPVGFLVVGVQLAAEAEHGVPVLPPRFTREIGVVVLLRLLVAPALVLAVSALLLDLPDGMLLQAVAPTGLNGMLVAHRFDLDLRPIAGAIVWTTGLVTLGAVVATLAGV
ncbi:AEC family transporter [Patulibacter defluvii]|uniref:AEC family transporter n=1 Tax=Patulibacter defluvii TaxID=3095358 RepID=UPI002A76662C|nr:AEC family transporter [Patulibacter sp. DM4]